MVCRPVVRPMDIDPSHVTKTVSTPTQISHLGEHPTRKAVPRQLDFTTMYGGPAGLTDNSIRPLQPSLYVTLLCYLCSYVAFFISNFPMFLCVYDSPHTVAIRI